MMVCGRAEKVVMGLNQSGNEGSLTQVYALRLRSGQCPHFITGPQGHDPLALDRHRFIDVARGVGNDTAVVHTDNLPIEQNEIRVTLLSHQRMQGL